MNETIPENIWQSADAVLEIMCRETRHDLDPRYVAARAILAERERWRPAVVYFERYCQDEADDDAVEWVGCSEQQHLDAKAFAAAIRRGSQ